MNEATREMFRADAQDPRIAQSLVRGLSLLTCFDPGNPQPRGIGEMAAELSLNTSTVHRYAFTLVHLGLLERTPDTRKYCLPKLDD